MKFLGVQRVPIADLVKPADWAERLKAQRVAERCASIKLTGGRPIHLPIVEASTMRILVGRDRLAALQLGGETNADVEIWSGSPAEAAYLEAAENLQRRRTDNLDELRVRAVEARAKMIEEGNAQFQETPSRNAGRPKEPRAEARRELAAGEGVTERAYKQSEQRVREAEQEASGGPPQASHTPKPRLVESRIRTLAEDAEAFQRETGEILNELIDVSGRTSASRHVANAVEGISTFISEMRLAAEDIERYRGKMRRSNQPGCMLTPGCIREAGHPAKCEIVRNAEKVQGPPTRMVNPPKTGLGGRKLEHDDDIDFGG